MSWLETRSGAGLIVNKRELSEILDVSEQTLTTWQDEGMPIAERGSAGIPGRYDTAEVLRWAVTRELGKRNATTSFDRLNDIRAQREMINLRREEGEVVMREDIRPAFRRYVNDVMAVMVGIPDKYAQVLELTASADGKRQVLQDMVGELRDVMGNYEFCATASPGGDSRVSYPAENVSGSVG